MAKRILVTGSRDWTDVEAIARNLSMFFGMSHILVSGACPTGADHMAEFFWRSLGGKVERHPADWEKHGKRAGFVRNAEMVNLGADVCVAFIKDNSRGASMTLDLAQKANIKTVVIRA